MNAYSKDLRVMKVGDALDRGSPRKELIRIFGLSLFADHSTLHQARRREGEDLAPKPSPGRTPTIAVPPSRAKKSPVGAA
jgi:transposase